MMTFSPSILYKVGGLVPDDDWPPNPSARLLQEPIGQCPSLLHQLQQLPAHTSRLKCSWKPSLGGSYGSENSWSFHDLDIL